MHQRVLAELGDHEVATVVIFVIQLEPINNKFGRNFVRNSQSHEHHKRHETNHGGDTEHHALLLISSDERKHGQEGEQASNNEVPLVVLPGHAVQDYCGRVLACEVDLAVG